MKIPSINYIYLYLVLGGFFMACKAGSSKNPSYEVKTVVIDVDDPVTLKLSQLVDTLRIVPLETKDHFIGEASQVVWGENNLYVVDKKKAKAIFVYDHRGRFIREINLIGNGPGQYKSLNHVQIIEDQNRIYISDGGHAEFLEIDLEGNVVWERKLKPEQRFLDFLVKGSEIYLIQNDVVNLRYKLTSTNLRFKDFKPLRIKTPNDVNIDIGGNYFFFVHGGNGFVVTNAYNPIVKWFKDGKMVEVIRFEFSREGLTFEPGKMYSSIEINEKGMRGERFGMSGQVIDQKNYTMVSFHEKLEDKSYSIGKEAVYLKEEKKAMVVKEIINDVDKGVGLRGFSNATERGKGVCAFEAPDFIKMREQGFWEDGPYVDKVNAIRIDEMDNPVLFIYDLKEEIDLE